eukprot:4950759-Pyramimonas_sp.AAC.1
MEDSTHFKEVLPVPSLAAPPSASTTALGLQMGTRVTTALKRKGKGHGKGKKRKYKIKKTTDNN